MATIEERLASAKKGQKAGTQVPAGSVQDRINRAKGSGATQSGSPQALSALQKYAEQQAKPVAITPMSQGMGVASFGKQMMGQTPSAVLGGKVDTGIMSAGEIKTAHGKVTEKLKPLQEMSDAAHQVENLQRTTDDILRQDYPDSGFDSWEDMLKKKRELEDIQGRMASGFYSARGEELSRQMNREWLDYMANLAMAVQDSVDKMRYGGEVGPDWSFLFGGEDAGGVSMSALQQLEKIKEQFVAAGWSREDIDRAIDYQVKTRREKAAQEEQKALQEKLTETEGKPVYRGGVGPDYSYLFGGESKNGVVTKQVPKDKGVDESVLAALSAPAQALDFINMRIATAGRNNTGDIDSYKPASVADMPATVYANAVTGTIAKRIEGEKPTLISKAAAFLYQTGMSMAQSTALAAGLGPFSLAVMGGSAAAGSALDVIERGGTNNQAFAAGIASGVAEVLFEKFSVENLLKGVGDSTFFKSVLKQAGIEASEEMATEIANILSDAVIMGRDSRFEESVRAYMDEGMSREQAEQKAFLDCVGQVALAGLGGALSGGGSMMLRGGGQMAVSKAVNNARENEFMRQHKAAEQAFAEIEGQKETASKVETESTAVNTDPTEHTPQEQAVIDAYQAGTNDELKELFEEHSANPKRGFSRRDISAVSERQAADAARLLGGDYAGYKNAINSNAVKHILKEHGPEGAVDHSLADMNDAARMGFVLDNYDDVEVVTYESGEVDLSSEFRTKENAPAPMLKFSKKVNGTYYVVEAIPESKYKKFWVVSAYMQTADGGTQALDADGPGNTPNASLASSLSAAETTVPQPGREVNIVPEVTEEDVQRSKRAKNFGMKAGLVRDDNLDKMHLSYRVSSTIDAIAKIAGVQVRVVKSAAGGKANGTYSNGVIEIAMDCENPVMAVFTHELVHRIRETSPESYAAMAKFVQENIGNRSMKALANRYSKAYETKDVGEWSEEMVADAFATVLNNRKVMEQFAQDNRTAFEKVRDVIRDMINAVKRVLNGQNARMTGEQRAAFSRLAMQLQEMENVMADAIKNLPTQEEMSVGKSGNRESAADIVKKSLKWDSKFMDAAEFANKGRISASVMQSARESRQAVADIFNDPDLADSLGLPPDIIGKTYIPNGSYSGTEENTTECIRTLAADDLMDAVAEYLGRPLTVEDTIAISQEYWKYTDKPECLYCYVAMDRKAHREFLGSYLQQRDDVVKNIESGMSKEDAYQKFLDGRKDTAPMKKRFDMWVNNIGKETISPADLASRASMEKAAAKSASFKAQVNDALKYAQSASWAKKRITYTAYDNHILKWKQNRIDNLNSNYGLRMYSFSDFSPAFILENMQMITDASVRGLKVLAYTKELDFVRIFAKTGMNINISVFGYNDGDGVAMDAMQGADWAEAQALRKKHSNVGCTFVATNDSQVEWALDQDWIDVIIPFHMVRTGTKVASAFGWKNYTAMSADTKAEGWTKENAKHILPPMHQNDKATYLKACKDNNLTPRFADWVYHPNYMKLVNETRQSEGDTNPVQPLFDLDAAKASIETMRKQGGYYTPIGGSRENMLDIAEEIGKKIESKKSMKSDSSSWKEAAEAAKQDVKDAKLAGMMNQGRKDAAQLRKAKETTAEVRRKRDEAIKELKQKQREREASMRESRNATAIRAKIERHVKDLSSKLRNPTDKKHIPEEMRKPIAKLLESINMESKDGAPTKRTKAFAELKEIYNTIAGDVVVDPDLFSTDGAIGLLDEVIAMADKRISEMSVDELETVWKTIRAIEVSIRNANKTFAAERYKTVQDAAKALWDDNIKKKDKGYLNGLRSLIEVDMLTPEAFFHRLGDAGDSLFKAMRAAQDKHIRLMKQVSDFTHENLEEINVKKLEKEIHTVTLGGQKVEMSAAQLMELYALMRRKQALDHLLVGGIKLSAIQKKGKKVNRSDVINGITYDELVEATSALDDDLLKVAELMQAYASTTLSDFGNEASMEVYGYRKFNEENYWPIRSSKSGLNEDIQQATQVTSVANRGFTKNAKPHANNAVQIGSIFDTFASHSSEMATYSAWLGVSEDLNRIRNFKYKAENADGSMRQIGTVKGLLDRVFGSGEGDKGKGQSYIEKLLTDIATGVKGGNDPTAPLTSGFIGNYKAASIGANLRVVIQQPTAILRSLELLDAKYLASGVASKWMKGFEKAKKYAPIAQWKDWGYFDIHTGRQMKDVLFESDSALEKTKEIAMKPAGWMDSIAWGTLWNAVEAETKDKTDLKPGTEEFYKKVAERFGEIIDRTQVVDGILQRSQIMRSPNSLAKMATPFMGEPTKQYNMLLSAIYDAKSTPEGKKRVLRTSISLASSALLNVVAQSIVDGLRDDDREEKYWERVLKAAVGAGNDDGGFWNSNLFVAINPAAYIPYIKDVWSIVDGYDVSRMDMDGIERTVRSAKALMKALQGKGTKATGNAVVSFVAEVARLFGIPLANVKREVTSVAITAAVASENYLLEYKTRKLLYRVSENTKMFYDILFDAMEAKDDEYYTIYADMLKSGLTEEKIKAAMEDRMKKKQGVNSVKDLEKRWEAPRPK